MEASQILAKNMEKKAQIRKIRIQKRLLMTEDEVSEKSIMITKMVLKLQEYQRADTIFCYVDFRNEVKTRKIMEESWYRNKRVAVPRIEGNVMHFYWIEKWTDLKEGYMGILEPKEFCKQIHVGEGNELLIMPGVAFDEKRNRLGYGGGYYDKYVLQANGVYKVALAFENQICQEIPCEEHDIRPDLIVTEKRMIIGK